MFACVRCHGNLARCEQPRLLVQMLPVQTGGVGGTDRRSALRRLGPALSRSACAPPTPSRWLVTDATLPAPRPSEYRGTPSTFSSTLLSWQSGEGGGGFGVAASDRWTPRGGRNRCRRLLCLGRASSPRCPRRPGWASQTHGQSSPRSAQMTLAFSCS
ncbi:hypothetical protein SKAU_G00257650 [Synaphobranchus kaupii]|uniref:Uncharacterized protein n=1 Tax=Synaphobranchus kaupii TaxID=118154 RepID=A0A9Q1F4F7_SYNKA|nr:hypothetical protein SKAU_G00257650 [Synaphobranchus kaupii]